MKPYFLMIREMHLLNTFMDLVLPFAANGYMIFLLKGFFDSLPRELYAAAMAPLFAAVLILSIQTILSFVVAQNVIMRGIVVPVEK